MAAKSSLPWHALDLEAPVLGSWPAGRPRAPPSSPRSRCPGCGSCRSTRCAAGPRAGPSASCSSLSALARLLWSAARRSRWRVNSSLALRVTVSSSARLSPRCGHADRDLRAPLLGQPLARRGRGRPRPTGTSTCLGTPSGGGVVVEALEDACRPARPGVDVLDLVDHEPLAARPPGPGARRTPAPPPRARRRRCRSRRRPRPVGHHLLLARWPCARPSSRSRSRAARSNSSSSAASRICRLEPAARSASVSPSRKSISSSTSTS